MNILLSSVGLLMNMQNQIKIDSIDQFTLVFIIYYFPDYFPQSILGRGPIWRISEPPLISSE